MSKRGRESVIFRAALCVALSAALVNGAPTGSSFRANETDEAVAEDPEPPNHLFKVKVSGIRVEPLNDGGTSPFLGYNSKRHSIVKPDEFVKVVFFGSGFSNIAALTFTGDRSCTDLPAYYESDFSIMTSSRLAVELSFKKLLTENPTFHLCISERVDRKHGKFVLIDDGYTTVTTSIPSKQFILPLWLSVPVLALLLCLSGLFSGLNLGLMTLTPHELQLYIKSGTAKEKYYAEQILPIRRKGNNLLCTLLLGNVVVNSAISLLLDDLIGNGGWALVGATIGIVIFGEVLPQAICVKRGLEIGAKTVPLTRIIMVILSPITVVIAYVLNRFLKEELTQTLGRKKLVEMMKMSRLVGVDEDSDYRMVLGALEINDKIAKNSMTKIEDVFMLPSNLKLGPTTMNQILLMGYTRVPIYENDRNNVVGLLFVQDMALLDPDDNMDVMKVCSVYKHELRMVDETTPLRVLLDEFKKGEYHLAMVTTVVSSDDADPTYQLVGLITLEDIIEEILQAEILDETDTVCDNVNRKKRHRNRHQDMSQIINFSNVKCPISIQMQCVTMQWIESYHEAFTSDYILRSILERLIRQNCHKVDNTSLSNLIGKGCPPPKPHNLYTKGQFSDKFILIVQGTVIITIGQENMCLEAGAWYAIGKEVMDALVKNVKKDEHSPEKSDLSLVTAEGDIQRKKIGFIPDFSASVRHDCAYIEISANDWLLAHKATLLALRQPEDTIIRTTSHIDLIVDPPSKKDWHYNNGSDKPRALTDCETMELLPRNNNRHIEEICDPSAPLTANI